LRTIGSWVLERRLGDGAFASVWLGRHAVLEGRRAIKVMHPQWVTNDRIRQRFLAEGRILARIEHKNIVEVIDLVDEPPDTLALVMDFIDGVDLETRLQRGDLRDDEILPILRGLLDGLAHAHRAGIVHRDLKPANLLLRSDGTPVLLDFGIARVTDSSEVATQHVGATRVQVRMGTPEYMAPELVISATAATPRSDLWAVGCIAFECLTQTPCFQGATSDDVYAAVVKGRHAPLDAVPEAWRPWIERLLAREAEDRPPSCADAVATMPSSIVRGSAASAAPPPGLTPSVSRGSQAAGTVDVLLAPMSVAAPSPRRGLAAGLVAAGLGVLAVTWGMATPPAADPDPSTTAAPAQNATAAGLNEVTPVASMAPSAASGAGATRSPAPTSAPTSDPKSVVPPLSPRPPTPVPGAVVPDRAPPGTAPEATTTSRPATSPTPSAPSGPAPADAPKPSSTPADPGDRTRVSAGVEAMWKVVEPRLRTCGGPPTAERQPWRVEVRVAADGKLLDVSARGADPTGTMAPCIESVVRTARFPASGAEQQRTFNVALAPKSAP
jgi:serine/threonine protein kinase